MFLVFWLVSLSFSLENMNEREQTDENRQEAKIYEFKSDSLQSSSGELGEKLAITASATKKPDDSKLSVGIIAAIAIIIIVAVGVISLCAMSFKSMVEHKNDDQENNTSRIRNYSQSTSEIPIYTRQNNIYPIEPKTLQHKNRKKSSNVTRIKNYEQKKREEPTELDIKAMESISVEDNDFNHDFDKMIGKKAADEP